MWKVEVVRTRSGRLAAWEGGGGMTSTGSATIVAGPRFERLAPLYIRRRGQLACSPEHALFPISAGYWVIHADHHRGDFRIEMQKFDGEKFAVGYIFDQGEWDATPPQEAEAAIETAKQKAYCYHCREVHFSAV